MSGLSEDAYEIEAEAPSRLLVMIRHGASHLETLEVSADREVVVEIVHGRVSGFVLDQESGAPIAGAELSVQPLDSRGFQWLGPGQVSADDGSFSLELGPGSYRLSAASEGYVPANQSIDVAPVQELEGLRLLLRREVVE